MLNYKPATAEELMRERLLPEGEYAFEINEEPIVKTSERGNQMLEISLRVYRPDGSLYPMRDWLMLDGQMRYKLRQCAESCGLLEEYENGTLDTRSFLGKSGYVKIKTALNKAKTDTLNSVAGYVKPKEEFLSKPEPFFYEEKMSNDGDLDGIFD